MVDIDLLQPNMPTTSIPPSKPKSLTPPNLSMDVMKISDIGKVLKFGVQACNDKIEKLSIYEKSIRRNLKMNRKRQDSYFKILRRFKDMEERYRINGELKSDDLEFWQQNREDLDL
jgi:hypothetical protein